MLRCKRIDVLFTSSPASTASSAEQRLPDAQGAEHAAADGVAGFIAPNSARQLDKFVLAQAAGKRRCPQFFFALGEGRLQVEVIAGWLSDMGADKGRRRAHCRGDTEPGCYRLCGHASSQVYEFR